MFYKKALLLLFVLYIMACSKSMNIASGENLSTAMVGMNDVYTLSFENELFTNSNLIERKQHIETTIEKIDSGNKLVAESVKMVVDQPGIIEGVVKLKIMLVSDAVVYIERINNNEFIPISAEDYLPEYGDGITLHKKAKALFPLMAHVVKSFQPKILPVLTGSIVDMPNFDTIRHNVFSPENVPGTNKKINLGVYDVGLIKSVKLENRGDLPLLCNIHKEMSAHIVALDNPYFCLTNEKGEFRIMNVPPGEYILKTWHERFKPVTEKVIVEPDKKTVLDLIIKK